MKSMATPADMKLTGSLFRYTTPEALPISFIYGNRVVRGIPADFAPRVQARRVDANLVQHIVCGRDAAGLEIRVECLEYLDFAATEIIAFFTNTGAADTQLISEVKVVDGLLPLKGAVLEHGNGDTLREDGYEWFREEVGPLVSLMPVDGTSCNGAFPYMRLEAGSVGVNIAVGWPAMWRADFVSEAGGVRLRIGQRRCHMALHPGETMRTPRVNFVAYTGAAERGANMWRRWYLTHILPRENGQPIPPKCCMHAFEAGGHPEFTGANEANQLEGLAAYRRHGLRPDIWWIDAGWYPCDYDWTRTGAWQPDPKRFPNGLTPIGKACKDNGMQLLLWFEPERVREGSALFEEHPEWMLRRKGPDGALDVNCLLDLGRSECCDALIELVDGLIKRSGVGVYRQDFNFDPRPYWEQAEAPDRIGAVENQHVQGYLRFWDALLARNPGLWIDSCASGGRRNDLETMRRAVPLHYTDVGYGNHPVKQKQHRQMFEWIPYFRAHNMNWDDPLSGVYGTENHAPDRYAYYAAMAPALTDVTETDASPEAMALAREMQAIWRRAAEQMLTCDYYPLTACRKSAEDFYALQFHDPERQRGHVEILRNNQNPLPAFCARLRALEEEACYCLTNAESGETLEYSGAQLLAGVDFALPRRSGVIYFYERKQVR